VNVLRTLTCGLEARKVSEIEPIGARRRLAEAPAARQDTATILFISNN